MVKGVMVQRSSLNGIQEEERDGERSLGQDIASKNTMPATYFLQVDPTSVSFPHLPIMSPNYESTHRLMQSPQSQL
jgi:hypothetical protein